MKQEPFAPADRVVFGLAVLAFVALALPGCLGPGEPLNRPPKPTVDNTVPLEFTYIRISEAQYATNAPIYQYTGHVEFPFCLRNSNGFGVVAQEGFEIFQGGGPSNPASLRLVEKWDSDKEFFGAGSTSIPLGMDHAVLMNETLEGSSTNYTIHLWNHILVPEPVHRQDLWFNMTFIPYHPGFTSYEKGIPC